MKTADQKELLDRLELVKPVGNRAGASVWQNFVSFQELLNAAEDQGYDQSMKSRVDDLESALNQYAAEPTVQSTQLVWDKVDELRSEIEQYPDVSD